MRQNERSNWLGPRGAGTSLTAAWPIADNADLSLFSLVSVCP